MHISNRFGYSRSTDSAMACAPATCPPPAAMVAKKIPGRSELMRFLYQPPRRPVPPDGAPEAHEERDLRPPPERRLRLRYVAGPGVDRKVLGPAPIEYGLDAGEPGRQPGQSSRRHHHARRQTDRADRPPERLSEAISDLPPGVAAGLGDWEGPEARRRSRRGEGRAGDVFRVDRLQAEGVVGDRQPPGAGDFDQGQEIRVARSVHGGRTQGDGLQLVRVFSQAHLRRELAAAVGAHRPVEAVARDRVRSARGEAADQDEATRPCRRGRCREPARGLRVDGVILLLAPRPRDPGRVDDDLRVRNYSGLDLSTTTEV